MDESVGHEGLFRDTLRWAMTNISVDDSQMKQHDKGSIGNSGIGGVDEVAPLVINGGKKRKNSGVEIKREKNQDSDGEDEMGIRDFLSSEHAKHLWTEKRRRKKMKNMFDELHALLPKQTPKAKLITIVDDAISYIRNLQQTLQKLETQKLERLNCPSTNTTVTSLSLPQKHTYESLLAHGSSSTSQFGNVYCPKFDPSFPLLSQPAFQTWASSNITLNVCGQDALINICSSLKPGLLTAICVVLEKCKLDIVSFHVSSDQAKHMFMIHARVNAPDEFLEAFPNEEIYKIAALEMMLLVDSKSS